MKNTTAIVLLVLSVALFYTFTSPQYDKVKELSATASEYRTVLANISKITETRDALLDSYDAIPRATIERLSKVLPGNVDTVQLAVDLDAIAARYGISVKNVRIDTVALANNASLPVLPEYSKPYDKTTVSFSFVSNYANFRKFLADLERSLRLMNVKEVSFQSAESGLYEHEVSIETYWLK
ncbi:MAG: hypothetical protein Q7R67_01965 [bacterium]|nr:hypothetical protein [bacterium]